MKNLHLLPTEKSSRIYLIKSNNRLGITSDNPEFTENFGSGTQNQNIYITNSEEIKEGDWFIDDKYKQPMKYFGEGSLLISSKKIVLTTDKDLIKDGVQSIDDEFLEWFVKNPRCEEVEVMFACRGIDGLRGVIGEYKIIIPKEEPKTNLDRLPFLELVKELSEYYNAVSLIEEPKQETLGKEFYETADKIITPKEEQKQETLEDRVKRLSEGHDLQTTLIAFANMGAKWMQERSYSKEEVAFIERLIGFYWVENNSEHPNNLKEWELSKKIIEQFKKK